MNPTFSCLQKSNIVFTNAPSRQLMWVKKFFKKKKRNDCSWRTFLPKGTWKDAPHAGDARAVLVMGFDRESHSCVTSATHSRTRFA